MLKVIKNNRVLSVDETDKDFYLKQGYDVVELDDTTKTYKVVQEATGGRTYSIVEYSDLKNKYNRLSEDFKKLTKENNELKKQIEQSNKTETSSFNRDEAKAVLTAKGVEFKGNASNEDLQKLLELNQEDSE